MGLFFLFFICRQVVLSEQHSIQHFIVSLPAHHPVEPTKTKINLLFLQEILVPGEGNASLKRRDFGGAGPARKGRKSSNQ